MAKTTEERILDRLDQILRILAVQVASEKSITEGVWLLKLAGLDNKTIAEVLNTSDATVRTVSSNLRRQRARSTRKVTGRG
ncbi:MAG: hypothetical protein ACRDHS_12365 [Actinomycetota bacterium]